jgi:hypothetical protein
MRDGDVLKTFSNIYKLSEDYAYQPEINIKKGLFQFIEWYK